MYRLGLIGWVEEDRNNSDVLKQRFLPAASYNFDNSQKIPDFSKYIVTHPILDRDLWTIRGDFYDKKNIIGEGYEFYDKKKYINAVYVYAKEDKKSALEIKKYLDTKIATSLVKWTEIDNSDLTKNRQQVLKNTLITDLVILVISTYFLKDLDFFKNLLNLDNSLTITIIPIILKECAWRHTFISNFQVLPNEGKAIGNRTNNMNERLLSSLALEIDETIIFLLNSEEALKKYEELNTKVKKYKVNHEYKRAIPVIKKNLKILNTIRDFPKMAETYLLLGKTLIEIGDNNEGKEHMITSSTLYYYQLNQLEKVEEICQEILVIFSEDIDAWKLLSKVYTRQTKNNLATNALRTVERLVAEKNFKRNKSEPFLIENFFCKNIPFFDDFEWNIQEKVNILLGKNGYGKTHLLRLIIAALSRNFDEIIDFCGVDKSNWELKLSGIQDKDFKQIKISKTSLEDFGKVPILAIPDTRFINKSKSSIDFVDEDRSDLAQFGSYHFLHQLPYENTVQNFLYGLCNDYMEAGQKFTNANFDLISNVFKELTGEDFIFYDIQRKGNIDFEMKVITSNNRNKPLIIQKTSQGTLSILAIVGLIYNFLKTLYTGVKEKNILLQRAIVMIDEVDAHLHPSWQQKIIRLLRYTFPNVQFILTAHSPLIVAGCKEQEVSVLRKKDNGFSVEQFDEDFIGYEAGELYKKIFEIEGIDENYKYYSAMLPQENELRKELSILEKNNQNLSEVQKNRVNELYDKIHYIEKVKLKFTEQSKLTFLERENRKLKSTIRKLKNKINTDEQ